MYDISTYIIVDIFLIKQLNFNRNSAEMPLLEYAWMYTNTIIQNKSASVVWGIRIQQTFARLRVVGGD